MRHLFIISNDGGPWNFASGVNCDAENYLSFFRSNSGGAWEDNEITVFRNNCTAAILESNILQCRMAASHYFLIVFVGHGYCQPDREVMFELNPGGDDISLTRIRDMVYYQKCLMIADSCEVVPKSQLPLIESRQRMFSQGGVLRSREEYRELYNQAIIDMPLHTFVFASACSFGEAARDIDHEGGLYSLNLLRSARTIDKDTSVTGVTGIGYPHEMARQVVVEETQGEQTPRITGILRGIQQPPFLVTLP